MFGWDSFGSPETQDEEKPTPITVEVAGTICAGWSPLGKRAGADSENHVAFLAWIAHVRKSKPVLVIHECHKNFPSSILDNLLEDQYKLYHIVVDPKMIGHPVNRPDGMYTWCVRKDHVLRGVEDFIEIFSASLVKNGDIFFSAPDGLKAGAPAFGQESDVQRGSCGHQELSRLVEVLISWRCGEDA